MRKSNLLRASKMLVSILVLSLLLGTVAMAAGAVSTTLRLVSHEGTVTVKNSAGNTLTTRDEMRLSSGYTISTSSASYAYISLDDDKAVKLDSLTTCTVKQKGNQLELLLTSGRLFFNVTAPLEETETMTVRTSSMVTGIRGTSGYVELTNDVSSVTLLSGKVEVTTSDVANGETQTEILEAGFELDVTNQDKTMSDPTPITEETVPAFVKVEVQKDPELKAVVEEQSGLDAEVLVANAEEELAEVEVEQIAQEAAAEEEIAVENDENKAIDDAAAAEEEEEKPSSGGSSGGSSIPANQFTGSTAAELEAMFNDPNITNVQIVNNVALDLGDGFEIPTGKTLEITAGTTNLSSSTASSSSTSIFDVDGTLTVANGATLTAASGITTNILSTNSLHINGNATFDGVLAIGFAKNVGAAGEEIIDGRLVVAENATLIANNLYIHAGEAVNNGKIELKNSDPSVLTIRNQGTFTNNGTLDFQYHMGNGGIMNNYGSITATTTVENRVDATFNNFNNATVEAGDIVNKGTFTSSGTIETSDTFNNSEDSTKGIFTNSGTIISQGGFVNKGEFTNETGGIITVSGDVEANNGDLFQFLNQDSFINEGTINLTDSDFKNEKMFNTLNGTVNYNACEIIYAGDTFLSNDVITFTTSYPPYHAKFSGNRGNGHLYSFSAQTLFTDLEADDMLEMTTVVNQMLVNDIVIDQPITLDIGSGVLNLGTSKIVINPYEADGFVTITGESEGKIISSGTTTIQIDGSSDAKNSKLKVTGGNIENSTTGGTVLSFGTGNTSFEMTGGFVTKEGAGAGHAVFFEDLPNKDITYSYAKDTCVIRANLPDAVANFGTKLQNGADSYFELTDIN